MAPEGSFSPQLPAPRNRAPARSPFPGGGFSVGRFFGIPVYVDPSWLIIFFLITVTISQEFARQYKGWLPAQHWFAGVVTSLLFFTCVFLHEMGHSLVARAFGIPVQSITLFIFGGVARIRSEPSKPWHEFLIAIAGPLTSVTLGILFTVLFLVLDYTFPGDGEPSMFSSIFRWLAVINVMLAVFNMVPGFPLDGGRVLRSAIWAVTGRMEGATRVAAGVGSFIAYMFIMLGIYLAVFENLLINGIWLALIGMFLLWAARSSVVQMTTRRIFNTLRVSDVVEPSPPRVPADMSVQELVDTQILQHGHRLFFVEDGGSLQGMVTLQEVKATARHDWPVTPVRSIMTPASDLIVAEPHVSLQTVMRTMDEQGIGQVPVVQGDRVVGIVTREMMHRILRTQLELGGR